MATLADQLAIQTRRAEEAEQRAEQAEQRAEEAEQRLLEEQARSEQHLLEEQARSEQRLLEEQARSEQRARADRALLDDARRAMQRYKNMAETQARHFRQQLDQALATIEDQGVEITALRSGHSFAPQRLPAAVASLLLDKALRTRLAAPRSCAMQVSVA